MINRDEKTQLAKLRELAKRLSGKISSTQVFDANVCSWTHPPGRPWESIVLSGEAFSKQLRFVHRGYKFRIFANNRFLAVEASGSFSTEPLSINRVNENDPLLQSAGPLTVEKRQYSSFTATGTHTSSHNSLFAKPSYIKLIRDLDLKAWESLHFMKNGVSLYLDHPSLSQVMLAIDNLTNVAADTEKSEEELDLSILPAMFHSLIPLIKKWAVGDDSDRECLLESSSTAALHSLVKAVDPFLQAIDSYLDSFGNAPPSEEACSLGRLAECTVEAKRLLGAKPS